MKREAGVALLALVDHSLVPHPLDAILVVVFGQDIARLVVTNNIPFLGAAMVAVCQFDGRIIQMARRLVEALVVIVLIHWSVMYAIAPRLARHEP